MNSTSPQNLEIMSKKNRSKNRQARQANKLVEEAEKELTKARRLHLKNKLNAVVSGMGSIRRGEDVRPWAKSIMNGESYVMKRDEEKIRSIMSSKAVQMVMGAKARAERDASMSQDQALVDEQ